MKSRNLLRAATVALVAIAVTGSAAAAQIRVVATTPDLASVAREIGGDKVSVVALAKPTEDPHYVDAKPSHIVTLNRADALIEGGAELELGWLPPLLENSRNSKISAGAPGRIVASDGVKMLEIPTSFDRSKGDVHSLGNPHFMIDPVTVRIVARNIASHFAQIDPKNAATYNGNLSRFNTKLDAKYAEWQKALAPYRGRRAGAKARHCTLTRTPCPGHRQDESGKCESDPRPAVSEPEDSRDGSTSNRRDGSRHS
jgi:zinc/manganese transport system substrate-binding protein